MILEMPTLIRISFRTMKTWAGFIYLITKFLYSKRNLFFMLYIISPIDLIPEVHKIQLFILKLIFGPLGLIDDASVGFSLLVTLANTVYGFLQ